LTAAFFAAFFTGAAEAAFFSAAAFVAVNTVAFALAAFRFLRVSLDLAMVMLLAVLDFRILALLLVMGFPFRDKLGPARVLPTELSVHTVCRHGIGSPA
jgi:hypothetical protein